LEGKLPKSFGAGAGVTFLGTGTGVKKVTPFTSALICEENFFFEPRIHRKVRLTSPWSKQHLQSGNFSAKVSLNSSVFCPTVSSFRTPEVRKFCGYFIIYHLFVSQQCFYFNVRK